MPEFEACVSFIIQGDSEITVKTSRAKAFHALDFLTGRTEVIEDDMQSLAVHNVPLEIPSRDKMEEYIRAQPEYQYSIEGIAKHFFGKDINSSDSDNAKRVLNGIRSKVQRIRESIEKSEAGNWVDTFDGRYKTFKFIKSLPETESKSSLTDFVSKESQNQD
jgi:hypothetical protein